MHSNNVCVRQNDDNVDPGVLFFSITDTNVDLNICNTELKIYCIKRRSGFYSNHHQLNTIMSAYNPFIPIKVTDLIELTGLTTMSERA